MGLTYKEIKRMVQNGQMILLKNKNGSTFYYDDELKILVPVRQTVYKFPIRGYEEKNELLQIGTSQFPAQLLRLSDAYRIFPKLAQIDTFEAWKIYENNWFLHNGGIYVGKNRIARRADSFLKTDGDASACDMRVAYLGGRSCLEDSAKFSRHGLEICDVQPGSHNVQEMPLPSVEPITPEPLSGTDGISDPEIQKLLDCDTRRCGLPGYEREMLYDIKAGHWDVFENAEQFKASPLIARDPKKDIKKNGIIGIDFGTKSTVVVKQENSVEIRPMRIGSLSLGVEVKEDEYENPTIISCLDLKAFLTDYFERSGRPETSYNEFFVSYNAYQEYKNCGTDDFYAYYSDLKQWANSEKNDVLVQDKNNKAPYFLREECSAENTSINPIELYAYYIGMYINNMRNGIYLKYIMSFPVKYSKETKELIRSSFEKGLRKSLPQSIVEDAELMKAFSVQYQISEPAAYAVTALERSGFTPQDETEKYLYVIFDFGGGTTDFDFGVWRGASDEEYDKYNCDYVLECFGADSDVNLGGENILEMLAYQVFKDNRKMAAEKKIACALPVGQVPFIGGENLINNSQSANRNLTILKEEFRPLWEQHENWEQRYKSGANDSGQSIEVQMYDFNGKAVPNCRFEIDTDSLLELIRQRIRKGVDAFFKCIEKAILGNEKAQCSSEKIYIFLAGNSSKSIFVKELFESTIAEYNKEYSRINGKEKECFVLIPPLTSEDSDFEYIPNAKTSVAYGLVKSRPGGKIRVIKNYETDSDSETRFRYYLGTDRRGKFVCKLAPVMHDESGQSTLSYHKWYQFQGAGMGAARIYYTENPSADSAAEKLNIAGIPFHELSFEPDENKYLFIRAVKPTVIEYAIAGSEDEIGSDVHELDIKS